MIGVVDVTPKAETWFSTKMAQIGIQLHTLISSQS